MIKPALSTIAFPDLALDQAIETTARLGYLGLELRSFGPTSSHFTPDPTLTAPAKARDLFEDAGIDPAALATSIRYDDPIFPPILGRIFLDTEAPVRQTKRAVELAAAIEAPFVRVFGFDLQPGESRKAGLRRIIERLQLAAATARHTGVTLLLESGGSFSRAEHLAELIAAVDSPLLAAAYSPAVGHRAGDDPQDAIHLLRPRLAALKLRDLKNGLPADLGEGDVPNEAAVRAAARLKIDCWAVVEHDRLWSPAADRLPLPETEAALTRAGARLFEWIGLPRTDRERRKFALTRPTPTQPAPA